jgi:hypothetical protein
MARHEHWPTPNFDAANIRQAMGAYQRSPVVDRRAYVIPDATSALQKWLGLVAP